MKNLAFVWLSLDILQYVAPQAPGSHGHERRLPHRPVCKAAKLLRTSLRCLALDGIVAGAATALCDATEHTSLLTQNNEEIHDKRHELMCHRLIAEPRRQNLGQAHQSLLR